MADDWFKYMRYMSHSAEAPRTIRRLFLYTCGKICLTPPRSSNSPFRHEVGYVLAELQQIGKAAQGTPNPRDNLWVKSCRIGPLRRNRADLAVIKSQQPPLACSVAALRNAHSALSAIGMKGVGYGHKIRGGRGKACISD